MTTRKPKTSAKRKASNIRAHPKARQKDKLPKRLARPCIAEYVEWNYVPKIGRGVIARVDALKGTVLERSPVVVAPVADFEAKHGKMTVLDHYLLTWEEKGEDVEYAVGLGYLMLYNHSASHRPKKKPRKNLRKSPPKKPEQRPRRRRKNKIKPRFSPGLFLKIEQTKTAIPFRPASFQASELNIPRRGIPAAP
ncbi:MAG: hypothetical protein HYU57_06885 [Micavibrio aeruginosavorus]|nr:hypothetical protein [Micavibrio aeruginosavorus]